MRKQKIDVQRAAVALFAEKGFAATGIRELGNAAGLNSATLYHHVGGKQELLVIAQAETPSAQKSENKKRVQKARPPQRASAAAKASSGSSKGWDVRKFWKEQDDE